LILHAEAILLKDDLIFEGEVQNLSLQGAFVTTGWPLRLYDLVMLTVDKTLACQIKAKVVRVTDMGMGLEFEKNLLEGDDQRSHA